MSNRTLVEALGPLVIETTRAGERTFATGAYSHVALSLTCLGLDAGLLVVDVEHQIRSRLEGKFDRYQPGPPIWTLATPQAMIARGETFATVIHRHAAAIGVPPALRVSWAFADSAHAKFSLTLFGVDG
jgi:hypothetical protein